MRLNASAFTRDLPSGHYCTILACPNDHVYASTLEGHVVRQSQSGALETLDDGWPAGAAVHRLQMFDQTLCACTNRGLFFYQDDAWSSANLDEPCYQVKGHNGFGYAATGMGLWAGSGQHWQPYALFGTKVYDFLSLPHYLVVAHERGMSFYDRYTGTWGDVYKDQGVVGLAAFHNHLIGVNDRGELIIGNKKGGLDAYRFGNMLILGITTSENDVFVCSDRGLFRLGFIGGRVQLLAVLSGLMVTDVDQRNGQIYIATLFDGIRTTSRE